MAAACDLLISSECDSRYEGGAPGIAITTHTHTQSLPPFPSLSFSSHPPLLSLDLPPLLCWIAAARCATRSVFSI
eukprot:scaffold322328_cov15-Tisochrysis_lutea.AAC.1